MAINEIDDLESVEVSPIDITDLEGIENKEISISDIENIPILKGPKGDTGDKGEQGEIGPQGPEGPRGEQGIQGEKGDTGPVNTLSIGTVEKGEEASAKIEGEAPNQTLNLVLPKGDKGESGEQGPPGESYDDTEIRKIIADEESHKYRLDISQDTEEGAEITLPCYYKVGQDVLDVYYVGQRLIKCSTNDDANTGHYSEVGEPDSISNKIKITSDWKASAGNYFEFVVRGEYSV